LAVYTHISESQFSELIAQYDVGSLVAFKGIAEGVSNTNYLVETTSDKYIATVYESNTNVSHLPFYWGLMKHLHGDGIPVPLPIHDNNNDILKRVDGCAFALVSFVPGKWPKTIRNAHCKEIGKAMACMHRSAISFVPELPNQLSVSGWRCTFESVKDQIDGKFGKGVSAEINDALVYVEQNWPTEGELPYGVIHGDLFPDNVFFEGEKLSALIDFYLSCNDFFAYDIAITLNAWCFEHGTEFNITKAKQLLKGYNAEKPLTEGELNALPLLCVGASLRFLISRLSDYFNQVEGAIVTVKDPSEYLKILRFHLQVKSSREYGL
jgi:homoserine kinase type II